MRTVQVSVIKVGALAGTRVILGIGIGLLVSEHLKPGVRRGLGAGMVGVGAASTIPLVASIGKGAAPDELAEE